MNTMPVIPVYFDIVYYWLLIDKATPVWSFIYVSEFVPDDATRATDFETSSRDLSPQKTCTRPCRLQHLTAPPGRAVSRFLGRRLCPRRPRRRRTPRQGASLITSESLPVSPDDLCPGLTPLICHFIPSALASLLANMSAGVLKPLHCLYV